MADDRIAKDPSLRPVERASSITASPIVVTATAVHVTAAPSSSSNRRENSGLDSGKESRKKKSSSSRSNSKIPSSHGLGEDSDSDGGAIPQGYIHGYVEAVPVIEEVDDPNQIQQQRRRRAPRGSVSGPSTIGPAASLAAIAGQNTSSTNATAGLPPVSSLLTPIVDERATKAYLSRYRWPRGLQMALLKNLTKVPVRFFVCDDSGSMSANDGQKIVPVDDSSTTGANNRQGTAVSPAPPASTSNSNNETFYRFVNCTRWNELVLALEFHAGLAHACGAPSEFRMLNSCMPVVIGDRIRDPEGLNYNYFMKDVLYAVTPIGKTPLCRHLGEIIEKIKMLAPTLRANGQKAAVIIATDGESSDGDLIEAMKPLQDLPVWVVVRLCTDNIRVVKYWNDIDESLELDMDVLDDIFGEAKEIKSVNPWFTYAEPIHRLREFGIIIKEIDLLDERKLSLDQIRNFAAIM